MTGITVIVHGRPAPQGSKRAFVRGSRAVIVDDSTNTKPWRSAVHTAIVDALPRDWEPLRGPVTVDVAFVMPRPKTHYTTSGGLKPTAPTWVPTTPDLDKLLRSTLDAIVTAGAIVDDRLIAVIRASKTYAAASPGASITITPIQED